MNKKESQPQTWCFVAPTAKLIFMDRRINELQIGEVRFMRRTKFDRTKASMGFPKASSKVSEFVKESLNKTTTVAVLQNWTDLKENTPGECTKKINDAINILNLSQLGYILRKNFRNPQMANAWQHKSACYFMVDKNSSEFTGSQYLIDSVRSLVIDRQWHNYHKHKAGFFFQLLKVLGPERIVAPHWKNNIRQAAILIGKGIASQEIGYAFLMNMIAIEMLVTQHNDKYSDVLPRRIEAFLGWCDWWEEYDFVGRIKRVYQIRCRVVHEGDYSEITTSDLAFTDCLLQSLLANILKHPKLFGCKKKCH